MRFLRIYNIKEDREEEWQWEEVFVIRRSVVGGGGGGIFRFRTTVCGALGRDVIRKTKEAQ